MTLSLALSNSPGGIQSTSMRLLSDEVGTQIQTSHGKEGSTENVLESPFSLLTPSSETLSGPLWVLSNQLGGQSFQQYPNTKTTGHKIGFSWGSMREIHMPPNSPSYGPSQSTLNQSLVPYRDPAPAFSRDILITRDFSGTPLQTEPHLAVHPKDPEHLLLGTVDYNFPNVSSYLSIDGGETWEGPSQPQFLRDDLGAGGDPVVGFDRSGNAYIAFISIGVEEFTIGPAVDFAAVSSIAVAQSSDGGRTWGEAVSSSRSGLTRNLYTDFQGKVRGEIILSFLDKPWMAIGPNPTNLKEDVIYITYTEFSLRYGIFHIDEAPFFGVPIQETTIKLVKSSDGGTTWSEPVSVSPTVRRIYGEGSGTDSSSTSELSETVDEDGESSNTVQGRKRTVQGAQPAVGPAGELFVTWLDGTDDETFEGLAEIYVSRSNDAGATFSIPTKAAVFNEPGFTPRSTFFRYWASAFPQMVVGENSEVYIAYTGIPSDKPSDDGDIFLVKSSDNGSTWDRPVRLNDDTTNSLQFFPSITLDPSGNIHAMWGDTRNDNANNKYHIYYTVSNDGGKTWGFFDETTNFRTVNARVTDFHSNPSKGFPGGRFIGDYFSIKATNNDVYMVWADTRLGEFGPVNQKIGFTRRTPIQSPEIFITPPTGPGGQSITLQGFNFQPEIDVFIRVGGVIVATERTNTEGRVTTQVFVPISGEGAHSIEIYDDSGNFGTASFFMEFGFDNLEDGQNRLERQFKEMDERLEVLGQAILGNKTETPSNDPTQSTTNRQSTGKIVSISLFAIGFIVVGIVSGAFGLWWGRRRTSRTDSQNPW